MNIAAAQPTCKSVYARVPRSEIVDLSMGLLFMRGLSSRLIAANHWTWAK
jgi:hypothetical protein